jgi:antitoxin VapB
MREFETKLERLRQWLDEEGSEAVEITRYSWLAWLLTGAEARVLAGAERGNCTVVVTAKRAVLVANNIEAPRLKEEEVGALPVEWVVHNWWESPPPVVPAGTRMAGEIPTRLRFSLLEEEAERARNLGREGGEALEGAARGLRAGLSELQIASRMAEQAIARGLVPVGLFVAADERGKQFRHPLPTVKIAHRNVILSMVSRRRGLHASVTRTVSFGSAEEEMHRRHRAVSEVHARMLAASRPQTTLGEVFAAAQQAYRELGFADEWTYHHQGGPAGYEAREARAVPDSTIELQENQMVAWNPTIRGAKSEETALIGWGGVELLTHTGHWPTLPAALPLADVLVL